MAFFVTGVINKWFNSKNKSMKKLIFLFLFFSFFYSAQAQNGLEINISTSWSYFRASSDILIDEQINNLYVTEKPINFLSGDVFYRKIFKKKWLLKTGIGWQKFGYVFEDYSNNFFKEELIYQQVTTSFLGGYHHQHNKWSGEIFAGFKPSYVISRQKTSTYLDALDNEEITVNNAAISSPFNVALALGGQINYSITPKLDISIGASSELQLASISESIFYQKNYYFYRITLGSIFYL